MPLNQIFSSTITQLGSNLLVLWGKFGAIFSMANGLMCHFRRKIKGDSMNHPPPTPLLNSYGEEGGKEGE